MSTSEDTNDFLDTYTEWTQQEDQWLWEQYADGDPIGEICRVLNRYPDDVITYIVTHSSFKIEDIPGFGGADHLELWQQQKLAFETNPLFNLRKQIRKEEFQDRMYNMVQKLYFGK